MSTGSVASQTWTLVGKITSGPPSEGHEPPRQCMPETCLPRSATAVARRRARGPVTQTRRLALRAPEEASASGPYEALASACSTSTTGSSHSGLYHERIPSWAYRSRTTDRPSRATHLGCGDVLFGGYSCP